MDRSESSARILWGKDTRARHRGSGRLKRLPDAPDSVVMGWLARRSETSDRVAERVVPTRSAPVEVQIMGRASLDVLRARNVSVTGLGVHVPHGFAGIDLAEEVELVVTLPGERPFLTRGVIKHVTSQGEDRRHFGLHFTSLDPRQRGLIEGYVEARSD